MTKKNSACHPVLALSSTVSKSCLYWCSSFTMLVEESYPNLAAKLVPKLEVNPVHGLESSVGILHSTTTYNNPSSGLDMLKEQCTDPLQRPTLWKQLHSARCQNVHRCTTSSYTPIYLPHSPQRIVSQRRGMPTERGSERSGALQTSCISDFTQSICCSDRLRSGLRPSSGGGFLKPARPSGYSKYSTYRQSSRESFRTARCGPLSARRVVREILSISMEEVDPDKLIFTMLRPPPLGSVTFQVPAAAKPSLFNVNIPSDFRVSSSSVNFPCGFHCHTATNSSIISWEASKWVNQSHACSQETMVASQSQNREKTKLSCAL